MSTIGSWVRFAVGIVLASEVIRQIVTGGNDFTIAGIISVIYIALGVAFFAIRF